MIVEEGEQLSDFDLVGLLFQLQGSGLSADCHYQLQQHPQPEVVSIMGVPHNEARHDLSWCM